MLQNHNTHTAIKPYNHISIILVAVLAFISDVMHAQIKDTLSGETLVNTEITNNQIKANIAVDSSGNYIIVWESVNQDGDAEGIYARRFNSAGDTMGQEFRVNVDTAKAQKNPTVAMNALGEYVIVWESVDQDGDKEGIYAQYYNVNGSVRKSEFLVNTVIIDKQTNPDVAIDTSGKFIVVWESFNGGALKTDIYARLFNDNGDTISGQIQVNTYANDDQKKPAVGMNSNTGEFVVAWQSKNQNGAANKEDIYAQQFDAAGAKVNTEFRVNQTTSDAQTSPAICMDTSKFIIAWASNAQDGNAKGVYAKIYDNTGAVLKAEFQVNTYITNNQDLPSIGCSDCTGGFNIVWESSGQDTIGTNKGIFGRIYNASGDTVSGEFQINTSTTNNQEQPVITATVRDTFIVAWQSNHIGNQQDVYKQRYVYPPDCDALRVNAGPDVSICYGDTIVIGGLQIAFGGTPPYTYLWMPADSLNYDTIPNPTANPGVTTTYAVTVTDSIGTQITDKMTVMVDPASPVANITAGGPTSFCSGDSVELVSGIASSYQWFLNGNSTGWATMSIIVFSAGGYQVVAENACGIDTSAVVTVTVNSCSATCSDGVQNQDETGVDCGGVSCPACPVETCSDGIMNQNETGVDCGGVCNRCPDLNIPDVFTPNGDGANETWIIKGKESYPAILVEVYNRWGSQIFSSPAGYLDEWDGKDTPDGVYYYIITLGDNQEPRTGTLTIVR